MNALMGLSSVALRKAADIKEQIERLERELNGLLGTSGPAETTGGVTRLGRATQGSRLTSGLTIKSAILRALEAGVSDVSTITSRVLALKGKASQAAIYQGLFSLKKDGKISNPARGQYTSRN
jgi:hypothetical protein